MAVKVAVVTGANKGIGFAIVRGLCKRFNGTVYLTSRNEERGKKAVADLNKEGLYPSYHQLDITDNKSVERFRDYIKSKYEGIDILINNAAIAFPNTTTEPAAVQAEQTIFVNYFSLVSACDILFPIVKNGGRVINVSSSLGHLSFIPSVELRNKFKDPNLTVKELSALMQQYVDAVKEGTEEAEWGRHSFLVTSPYLVSKAGVIALTKIQQKQLNDRDIKVNAVHPGFVDTDMSSHMGTLTIDQGARSSLYMALDAPDSVKGEIIWCDNRIVNWDGELPKDEI